MNKKPKINRVQNIIFYIFAGVFMFMPSAVFADKSDYKDSTIRRLTDHLFEEKMIDFEEPGQFKEYAMIEDCEIFDTFFSNDFEWNRIRLAVKAEMESLKPSIKKTKIRVPGKIDLTRYNFTTQSFDLHEDHVFNSVGFLEISESRYEICDREYDDNDIKSLPRKYYLKPEVPFNLFRIPVSKVVAKQVLDKIPPNKNDTRTAYIDINITLDAFFEISSESKTEKFAYVLGKIDNVNFYTDKYRRNKFKTLTYDEY